MWPFAETSTLFASGAPLLQNMETVNNPQTISRKHSSNTISRSLRVDRHPPGLTKE
jgi:hypothetical protein